MPDMWRGLRVSELKPTNDFGLDFPVSKQEAIIKSMQEYPLKGHSFFGPSGTGKSRFLHCLLQEAIEANCRHIFYSKMAQMIRGIKDNEFNKLPEERWHEIITPDDMDKCSVDNPLHIFIDEFDKVKFDDDIYLRVFELVDFIYEHHGKAELSICSNLSFKDFAEIYGPALLRRIQVITTVHEL